MPSALDYYVHPVLPLVTSGGVPTTIAAPATEHAPPSFTLPQSTSYTLPNANANANGNSVEYNVSNSGYDEWRAPAQVAVSGSSSLAGWADVPSSGSRGMSMMVTMESPQRRRLPSPSWPTNDVQSIEEIVQQESHPRLHSHTPSYSSTITTAAPRPAQHQPIARSSTVPELSIDTRMPPPSSVRSSIPRSATDAHHQQHDHQHDSASGHGYRQATTPNSTRTPIRQPPLSSSRADGRGSPLVILGPNITHLPQHEARLQQRQQARRRSAAEAAYQPYQRERQERDRQREQERIRRGSVAGPLSAPPVPPVRMSTNAVPAQYHLHERPRQQQQQQPSPSNRTPTALAPPAHPPTNTLPPPSRPAPAAPTSTVPYVAGASHNGHVGAGPMMAIGGGAPSGGGVEPAVRFSDPPVMTQPCSGKGKGVDRSQQGGPDTGTASGAATAESLMDKKPFLACEFCRHRKIACGQRDPHPRDCELGDGPRTCK